MENVVYMLEDYKKNRRTLSSPAVSTKLFF